MDDTTSSIITFIITNCIAIISLLISIITFIYNYHCNKMNLKITYRNSNFIDFNDYKYMIINCIIDNKSRHFISINNVYFIFNNQKFHCISEDILLGSTSKKVLGADVNYEESSHKLPYKIDSYDSFITSILFEVDTNFNIPDKLKIKFNTSRGVKKLTIKNNTKN